MASQKKIFIAKLGKKIKLVAVLFFTVHLQILFPQKHIYMQQNVNIIIKSILLPPCPDFYQAKNKTAQAFCKAGFFVTASLHVFLFCSFLTVRQSKTKPSRTKRNSPLLRTRISITLLRILIVVYRKKGKEEEARNAKHSERKYAGVSQGCQFGAILGVSTI